VACATSSLTFHEARSFSARLSRGGVSSNSARA